MFGTGTAGRHYTFYSEAYLGFQQGASPCQALRRIASSAAGLQSSVTGAANKFQQDAALQLMQSQLAAKMLQHLPW